MMSNGSQSIKCYFQETDSIRSLELNNPSSNFGGEVYLMCDNKHVLKYIRNPDGYVYPDPVSNTLEYLKDKYPEFFSSNIADDVMEHYNYAFYFITTEYWPGAAYSIRTLLERLIYDNYGPYFFSEKYYLNFKTDKEELENINSRIGTIGFLYFIITILSDTFREDIKEGKIPNSLIGKNGARDDLMKMIIKIENDRKNKIFINEEHYEEFKTQYKRLSEGLHPRTPIDRGEAERALNVVLAGYQSYFNNGNTWRVKYD
jgi:hypothetical protein